MLLDKLDILAIWYPRTDWHLVKAGFTHCEKFSRNQIV